MSIWYQPITLEQIQQFESKQHLGTLLGIKFSEIGKDYLKATMPVDERTRQPFGILHGGASCVLAETAGSVGAYYTLDTQKQYAVGLDINTTHIRSISEGIVTATATPIHLGNKIQVWQIRIEDETQKLISLTRFTAAVLDRR